ncbi:MAG: M48 family peptidase, partial [Salegentibacter sp.]
MRHNRKFKKVLLVVSTLLLLVACKTNPFTGEKNLNFVSNEQIFPASFQQYDQFLQENQVVTGTQEAQMIQR